MDTTQDISYKTLTFDFKKKQPTHMLIHARQKMIFKLYDTEDKLKQK